MTPKSPLSSHFRGVSCTATRLCSTPDCRFSKGLHTYSNNILNGVIIDKMICIIKLVLTIISNLIFFV